VATLQIHCRIGAETGDVIDFDVCTVFNVQRRFPRTSKDEIVNANVLGQSNVHGIGGSRHHQRDPARVGYPTVIVRAKHGEFCMRQPTMNATGTLVVPNSRPTIDAPIGIEFAAAVPVFIVRARCSVVED